MIAAAPTVHTPESAMDTGQGFIKNLVLKEGNQND
jgi:hypothetical protein